VKVALYARVSTEDKGQDPTIQLNIIRDLAQRREYEIICEYVDYASGKDANRPKFKEMMERASNHDFDAIMALRLDRVMRSIIHFDTVTQQLAVYNVSLIFTDMEFDPNTPNGRLIINFLSSMAQWEREMISARTREGIAARKAKGQKFGRKKRDDIPLLDIAKLRIEGKGWKTISAEVDIPRSTLLDRKLLIEDAMRSLGWSENPPLVVEGSDREGVV
jgi:Site-specific recombinases, DNA invertase Pin homologs